MILINLLIWDNWNRKHIAKHGVTTQEVDEVFEGNHQARLSYRKRLLVTGKTNKGRSLMIVLSPEDRNLKAYDSGVYYFNTAFEREKK